MSLTQEQETCLIHLAQHGTPAESKDAINQLLAEHQPALYQYAMRALGDHSKSEEAVQNTLIHVWQALVVGEYVPNTKSENPFRHWLLACCKLNNYQVRQGRLQDDRLKYRERAKQRGYDKYLWTSTAPVETIEGVERKINAEQSQELQRLAHCVEMLPERNRRVFKLYTDGYTAKEISQMCNLKIQSVYNRISEAKKLLKTPKRTNT